jgi:hypothetical protein
MVPINKYSYLVGVYEALEDNIVLCMINDVDENLP